MREAFVSRAGCGFLQTLLQSGNVHIAATDIGLRWMEAGRLDQVQIDVAGELVEISWDERNELLERIRIVVDDETILAKFEAAGTRRPVQLDGSE